jgi:hypothetical protein
MTGSRRFRAPLRTLGLGEWIVPVIGGAIIVDRKK